MTLINCRCPDTVDCPVSSTTMAISTGFWAEMLQIDAKMAKKVKNKRFKARIFATKIKNKTKLIYLLIY